MVHSRSIVWHLVGTQDTYVVVQLISTRASERNEVFSIAETTKQAPHPVAKTSKRQFLKSGVRGKMFRLKSHS